MRNVYLLAAGLIAGLAIPVTTLPQPLVFKTESNQIQLNTKEGLQAVAGETVASTVETPSPEFSNPNLPIPVESSVQSIYQPTRRFLSGSQLYYHRLAALKAGQIYTRLSENELQSLLESGKKPQLTYEDWKSLLAMEARAMVKGQGANRLNVLVGDSLSMWFPNEKLPAGKLWLNQGISGDTSSGILNRLSAFAATKPDVIYVMAGINDLRKGMNDQAILRNYRLIIRRLRQNHPGSLILVQSILPTRLASISNSRIRRLNSQLALITRQEKASYLNLHDWFADFQGNLREDLTTDGLHLSKNGYGVWQVVLEQMESNFAIGEVRQESLGEARRSQQQ
ncbi:SGNH/GDSL hydrolase family protein [Chlorogloeopsis sp. ULAP02]|uniref:SGNH/GDSL hydrolase family protein n=1 Tax=Chlorogloeopsis sp. ULAP02 TaxID=3107926 RepID=UPI0031373E34